MNGKNVSALVSVLALGFCLVSVTHATIITFEELPGGLTAMANAPGAAIPTNSQLTNQYLASDGVSFTSLAGYAALVNHGNGNPTASIPNIIGGTMPAGALNYSAPITISFFDVANTSIMATTDTFKIQGDWFPLGSGQVFAEAFGLNGNSLGTTSDTDNKVFGVSGPVLQFNINGIHSVIISGDSGTVGFDQLEYGALTPAPVSSVPEPSTVLLLTSGLLGLAGYEWRKRKA